MNRRKYNALSTHLVKYHFRYCCPIPQGCQKRQGDGTLSRCYDAIGILYLAGTASIAVVREHVPYSM
jgi:hypothetical protein